MSRLASAGGCMEPLKSLGVLAALTSFTGLGALAAPTSHIEVRDPYRYVWDTDEGNVAGMTRFFLDLDDDGTPELFLAANSLIGNGGGPFHVFTKTDKGYAEIGVVFLSPYGFQLVPDKHQGFHDIKAYTHLSAESGTLVTYVYGGSEYGKVSDSVVSGEVAAFSAVSVAIERICSLPTEPGAGARGDEHMAPLLRCPEQ